MQELVNEAAAEETRSQQASEALRGTLAELESRVSLLELEKAELGAAVAALEREANRSGEEARRSGALAEDLRQTLAARELLLAEAETALAELQIRRFVRPRTKWLALSQLGSWLTHPHRGGWRLMAAVPAAPPSGTFAAEAYLAENPDVDASGLDPLMHYVEHGIREGRRLAPKPSEAEFAVDDVANEPAAGVTRRRTPPTAWSHLRLPRSQLSPSRSEPNGRLGRPPAPRCRLRRLHRPPE